MKKADKFRRIAEHARRDTPSKNKAERGALEKRCSIEVKPVINRIMGEIHSAATKGANEVRIHAIRVCDPKTLSDNAVVLIVRKLTEDGFKVKIVREIYYIDPPQQNYGHHDIEGYEKYMDRLDASTRSWVEEIVIEW